MPPVDDRATPGADQAEINPDPRLLAPCDGGRAVITEPLADLHDELPGGVVVGIQRYRAPRRLERCTKITSCQRISGRLRTDLGGQSRSRVALLDNPFGRADLGQQVAGIRDQEPPTCSRSASGRGARVAAWASR